MQLSSYINEELILMTLSCCCHHVASSRTVPVAGKINQVKSKWGVGCAAVLTVLASLAMSVGVCTYFGLNISVRGR